MLDALFDQGIDQFRGYFIIRLGEQFAGFRIDHIVSENFLLQILLRNRQSLRARLLQFADVPGSYPASFLDDQLPANFNSKNRVVAAKTLRYQTEFDF